MKIRGPYLLLIWLGLGCLLPLRAQAQWENAVWYFGIQAGVSFVGGNPVGAPQSAMISGEGCASLADAQGNLQLYTNGITVWNRAHQVMVNGTDIGGYAGPSEAAPNSATQGALIVPRPGHSSQYYIFTVDAAENGLRDGLRYAWVDVSRQNGRGEVLSRRTTLPTPTVGGRVAEKLTGVRHANGRDIWVLVHGWENNLFMAFLVTDAGVSAAPVRLSAVGAVHEGGANQRGDYNSIGYMRASADGRKLAVARFTAGLEVFDFDPQTGAVTNALLLNNNGTYGVEFSPSSQLLYSADNRNIWQYNLRTGGAYAVAANSARALLLAPNNRIYLVQGSSSLAEISQPDVPGLQCGYRPEALFFPGTASFGLPNQVPLPRPVDPRVYLGFAATPGCLGQPTSLRALLTATPAGVSYTWDFGDPQSGTNTGIGAAPTHVFSRAGDFRVTVRVTWPGNSAPLENAFVLRIPPLVAELGPALRVRCPGQQLILDVGPQEPSTRIVWQGPGGRVEGSRTLWGVQPGTYWVELTSRSGCTSRDTVRVIGPAQLGLTLGADTAGCFGRPLTLRVTSTEHLPGLQCTWSDGSTSPTLNVTRPGVYTVEVNLPGATCPVQLTRTVAFNQACLGDIPNIITPNEDGRNDAFVLPNLAVADWSLEIYDRWGRRVYAKPQYDNNWRAEGLAAGTYYYLLRYQPEPRLVRGWLEVVR